MMARAWLVPVLVLATGCETPKPKPPTGLRPVRAEPVTESMLGAEAVFSAAIQAKDASQVSFRVGGIVTKVGVKFGDRVKKGQLLAKLDERDLKVQVSQARANASSAKAQRDLARRTLQRTEKLFESGAATRSAYDNAKGQLRAAQAQLVALGQVTRQAKNSLQYSKLVAPFDGIVNAVNAREGETVGAGAPVFVISKGGALEVQLGVPENVVSQLKDGQSAMVTVPALDPTARPAKISKIGFAPVRNTYPISLTLDAPEARLRPGMVASVRFEFGERTATLTVPAGAVGNAVAAPVKGAQPAQPTSAQPTSAEPKKAKNAKAEPKNAKNAKAEPKGAEPIKAEPIKAEPKNARPKAVEGSYFVFTLVKAGEAYTVKRKTIEVGPLEGDRFPVVSGLTAGELVATAGLSRLVDGMTVRLLQPEGAR